MKINDIIVEYSLAVGDSFDIELGDTLIQTGIVGIMNDGVVLESDSKSLALLESYGAAFEETDEILEENLMTEVDALFQDLALDVADIDQVMNNPKNEIEDYASQKLRDIYQDVIIDYDLDPVVDKEKITTLLSDRLASTYLNEAEYQGRKVPLGKPMRGDVKKSKVYVRGPKGNVVKVNFGDKKMKIKKSNPKRRKSFRARHNCDNPGPRWKARYWAGRSW